MLLSYPRVKPPTEIVHQALLYWDGIASIVPRDPYIYGSVVSDELEDLRSRELYTPLTLDSREVFYRQQYSSVLRGGRISRLLEEQLATLERLYLQGCISDRHLAFVYPSKMPSDLERTLIDLHLARRVPGPLGRWRLAVPREVWDPVVSVMVRDFAAGQREVAYVPYTSIEGAYRWALEPVGQERALAWEMELGKLLPVPAPGTSTADVLNFRETYKDERIRLMRALHRMLGDLRRDYEHPAEVLAQLKEELKRAVEDYRGAVKSSRMAWLNRGITVTAAVGAGVVGAYLTTDLNWLMAILGSYGINVATREIRPLRKARREHDFAYFHRVQTTLA
ncbi:hypothetical protein ACFV8Z_45440 [Streptomyces sp. NPDC059837]|uniref:hypothetical protein n=1 Tax=unclassified Streptomyces TaxID=2593676 RepID=UPI0036691BBF